MSDQLSDLPISDLPVLLHAMSTTSGYLSTTESESSSKFSSAAAFNTNNTMPTLVMERDSLPREGGVVFGAQTSMLSSAAGDEDVAGFSSDSDYGGQSDCERDGDCDDSPVKIATACELGARQKVSLRKRKVAVRRVPCGVQSQTDPATESNRTKSSSTDSAGEDNDDYVDIQPVDLPTKLAVYERLSVIQAQIAEDADQSRVDLELLDGGGKVDDDDDYEEMAPQDPYSIAGFRAAERRNTYNTRMAVTGVYVTARPIHDMYKSKRNNPEYSTVSEILGQPTAAYSSGSADSCGEGVIRTGHVLRTSPVTSQRSGQVVYETVGEASNTTTNSTDISGPRLRKGSVAPNLPALPLEDGEESEASHDYTNVQTKDEMPLADMWMARKQVLHDYADPDYAEAGDSGDDGGVDDGDDDHDGAGYEAGVRVSDRDNGYQSRAGFHNIEVTSEPESCRNAVSPPIAHKLRRKGSEGALFKLPTFPVHPAATISQRRDSRTSLSLGLGPRPMSRVDNSSGSLTPGALRASDITFGTFGGTPSSMKSSGYSTPTLREKISSSFGRFGSPSRTRRPTSSLSSCHLSGSSSTLQAVSPGGMSLPHQLSSPRMRHSLYVGDGTPVSFMGDDRQFSSSARHNEYDSIASKWTMIDEDSPTKSSKTKHSPKRSPFSLLGKKKKSSPGSKKAMSPAVAESPLSSTSHSAGDAAQQLQHVGQPSDDFANMASLAKSTLV